MIISLVLITGYSLSNGMQNMKDVSLDLDDNNKIRLANKENSKIYSGTGILEPADGFFIIKNKDKCLTSADLDKFKMGSCSSRKLVKIGIEDERESDSGVSNEIEDDKAEIDNPVQPKKKRKRRKSAKKGSKRKNPEDKHQKSPQEDDDIEGEIIELEIKNDKSIPSREREDIESDEIEEQFKPKKRKDYSKKPSKDKKPQQDDDSGVGSDDYEENSIPDKSKRHKPSDSDYDMMLDAIAYDKMRHEKLMEQFKNRYPEHYKEIIKNLQKTDFNDENLKSMQLSNLIN